LGGPIYTVIVWKLFKGTGFVGDIFTARRVICKYNKYDIGYSSSVYRSVGLSVCLSVTWFVDRVGAIKRWSCFGTEAKPHRLVLHCASRPGPNYGHFPQRYLKLWNSPFFQSLSIHSHLSLDEAHLLECDSLAVTGGGNVGVGFWFGRTMI